MANFGIGLGSFLTGLTEGANAAANIQNARSRQKLTDMQIKNLEGEQSTKQGAKDLMKQGMDEAKANTDGQTDNVMNYYMQNTAPKLQQYWLANGEPDKANAFGKWIQDSNVQQGMRLSAGMIRAAQLGDPEGVMNSMVKLYNQPGYFEDGMSAVGAKLRRDDKGNAAGMDITLRNNKTGEETTHTFESMDDVYKTAMQFGAPDKVFEYGMQQLKAGQEAQVAAAKEGRDWQRKLTEKEIDQGYKLEGQNNESQLRRAEKAAEGGKGNKKVQDAEAAEEYLRSRGIPEDRIKALAPTLVGVQNQAAPMSKRIDDLIKVKDEDFTDKEWKKLSSEEKAQRAYEEITTRDKVINDQQGLGLPQGNAQQPQTQGSGELYFDTRTGQIISR